MAASTRALGTSDLMRSATAARPAPVFASFAPSSARNPSAIDAVSESITSIWPPSTDLAAISAAP